MSTSVGAENGPYLKLPLWRTIRISYANYFRRFGDVLRISALWLLPIAALNGAMGWLQASWIADMTATPQTQAIPSRPIPITVLGGISNLALALAAVSIAVAWHRLLLLDERPGLGGSNIGTRSLWRYVGITVVVCLIAALPVAAVLVPMSLLGWLPASGEVLGRWTPIPIVAGLLADVAGIWLLLRLCLLLPARAAGDLNLTFKQAWQRSRGNAWRLFWGILACVVPMLVVVDLAFVGVILIPLGNGVLHSQWAVASAIAVCCWLLTWPVWIGFLSYASRYFWRPA
jgi:hypothetical protein